MGTDGPWQEVIGVVADVYDDGADQDAPPTAYWPARSHPFVAGTTSVAPIDATTFIAATSVLAMAAFFATYIPASRAASVDPMRCLRSE